MAVEDREYPDGRLIGRHYGIPVTCDQMPPATRVTITASGEVSPGNHCPAWHAGLALKTERAGLLTRLKIATNSRQSYPVHLQGMATTNAEGRIAVVIEVSEIDAVSGGCAELRFEPGFTLSVVP